MGSVSASSYRVMAAIAGQHGEGLLAANLMDSGERDGRSTACRVGRDVQRDHTLPLPDYLAGLLGGMPSAMIAAAPATITIGARMAQRMSGRGHGEHGKKGVD
jgi:hypothetical protein